MEKLINSLEQTKILYIECINQLKNNKDYNQAIKESLHDENLYLFKVIPSELRQLNLESIKDSNLQIEEIEQSLKLIGELVNEFTYHNILSEQNYMEEFNVIIKKICGELHFMNDLILSVNKIEPQILEKKNKQVEGLLAKLKKQEAIAQHQIQKSQKIQDEWELSLNNMYLNKKNAENNLNNEFKNYLNKKDRIFNSKIHDIDQDYRKEIAKITSLFESEKEELISKSTELEITLTKALENANLLVSAAGEKSLNDGYKKYSEDAKKSKKTWQIIALVPLLAIVIVAFISVIQSEKLIDMNYFSFSRLFLTSSLAAFAAFCIRQSKIAYLDEKTFKNMELKLGTIGAYLSDFSIEKQHSIKEQLVQDYFSVQIGTQKNMYPIKTPAVSDEVSSKRIKNKEDLTHL